MGAFSGPNIPFFSQTETYMDMESNKSFNTDILRNHLLSKWYAHFSASLRYAIIGTGVTLYDEDMNGNVTELVGPTTSEITSGDLSVSQGHYYYGNGPVAFYDQATQSVISPLSLAGNLFWTYVSRYTPVDMYVFAPHSDATIEIYSGGSGVNGTPIQTVSINAQQTGQSIIAPSTGDYFFKSDSPVIMTRHSGGDRNILKPMEIGEYIYIRATEQQKTSINTTPSQHLGNYVKDDNYPCMTQAIADGSGGDMEVGLAHKNLSDTYVVPDDIASYYIVAPNTNTVYVEYWNGSSWTLHDTHTFNGTESSPDNIAVGDQNGADASIAGTSNGTWRFRGDDIFYVLINDVSNDEEALLGYMRTDDQTETSRSSRNLRSSNVIKNVSKGQSNIRSTDHTNIIIQDNGANYIEFDGQSQNVVDIPNVDVSGNWTVSSWIYLLSTSDYTHVLTSKSSQGQFACKISTGGVPYFYSTSGRTFLNGSSLSLNEWYNLIYTYDGSQLRIYINGELNDSENATPSLSSYDMIVNGGNNEFNSFRFSNLSVFTVSFGEAEALRYYSAFRRRYK